MALPKFKKKEEIPAGFEDLYEEKDGEWVPKDKDTAAEDGLREALGKERKIREEAEKKLKAAEQKEKERERQREAGDKGISAEQLAEITKKVRADLEAEYAPHKETAEKSAAQLRELQLDRSVKSSMMLKEVGVKGEHVDDLWKLIRDDFDLTTDGKPMVKNHPGLKIEQYLADAVKKRYGIMYQGTKAEGGNAGGGSTGGGGERSTVTAESLFKNPSAALQSAREAGVKE